MSAEEVEGLSLEDDIKVSKITSDKAKTAKTFIENFYARLDDARLQRLNRRQAVEAKIAQGGMSPAEQSQLIADFHREETEHLRQKRRKVSVADFDMLTIIGRGAFGEVRIVRKKDTGQVFAMKKLKKSEMLRKDQVNHVRAERDVMALADNPWVVKLHFSFQDPVWLYLIMEYLPGGDLMTIFMRLDTLEEPVGRFFLAEMALAIHSVHQLGFIHRDLKPDNILITHDGHMKLTDFGLCTKFAQGETFKGMDNPNPKWQDSVTKMTTADKFATWKKKRQKVFSTVGTPDYIAPEVFWKTGYGKECDWWSMGVIMFEMLVGYPPFYAEDSTETCHKIVRWRETLVIPDDVTLTPEARDLIQRLLCDRADRLDFEGVKRHPFFKSVDWDTIHMSTSPLIPTVNSETDTQNFDEFEEVPEQVGTIGRKQRPPPTDMHFYGYTFKRFEKKENKRALQGVFNRP